MTFTMLAKAEVNGPGRSPLFAALTGVEDQTGSPGDVTWNLEKWLLTDAGQPVARFRPSTEPDDPALTQAITDHAG